MAFLLQSVVVALLLCFSCLEANPRSPQVQVYSRHPVEIGKPNIVNCYVDKFHPPKINITLLKNDQPLENMKMSDLSFGSDWAFNRLAYAEVTPDGKTEFKCKVEHSTLQQPKIVKWDQEY
ncbi:beta-2-microglobulin [Hemicordylus capensis]|uniref:beta-2-microglobulin n=1 Tax=Hemicordylus capensis TaxID=884348 RepID=UPI0023037CED|nr:beta-2-microglobulin [Hemicordylus capensis]